MKANQNLRISQIIHNAQGYIAITRGTQIVSLFTSWEEAKEAYKLINKKA
jgi:hypothetical protein